MILHPSLILVLYILLQLLLYLVVPSIDLCLQCVRPLKLLYLLNDKHIKNFSELALPLADLTKKGKGTIVEWSEACEKSFNDLKSALSALPTEIHNGMVKAFVIKLAQHSP
jgi:hypothetical protein